MHGEAPLIIGSFESACLLGECCNTEILWIGGGQNTVAVLASRSLMHMNLFFAEVVLLYHRPISVVIIRNMSKTPPLLLPLVSSSWLP